jgi:TPR repeat protein
MMPIRRLLLALGLWSAAPAPTDAQPAAVPPSADAQAQTARTSGSADRLRHLALKQAVADYEAGHLDTARTRFMALAQQGEPAAMHDLGIMNLRDELPGANPRDALRWLRQAATLGFVTSQVALGHLYEGRLLGEPDLAAALMWYERAARSGSVDAQVEAGTAYFMGRGTALDYARAAYWYTLAASAGDVGACYILASMYEHGEGVPADLRQARDWYQAAADAGDEAAPDKVREMDARLAPPDQ